MRKIISTHKQRGATLIVSMFILLILTVLGVTSMRTTVLEERMTSNERNRAIALHAAESGLRDGEAVIESLQHSIGYGTGSIPGQIPLDGDEPDALVAATWNPTAGTPVTMTPADATTNIAATSGTLPKYFAKEVDRINDDGSLNIGGYDAASVSVGITNFRVTSKGLGADTNAEVILQTHYGVRVARP